MARYTQSKNWFRLAMSKAAFKERGLLDWSIEAAVLKFPDKFSQAAQACADFRLNVLAKNP
jgi:hypothetical protein